MATSTTTKRTVYDLHPCKGGWEVKMDGQGEKTYERKSDALSAARQMAKGNMPSQLRVHGSNGRLQSEYTYGGDPRHRKG